MQNRSWLIDGIVRQTTVLIAQVATASGQRSPIGHIAEQVFLDLVRELETAGLGQKIIADMFGLALRTYHSRVQRISESSTDQGRTLWMAVLEYLRTKPEAITRADVLKRFCRDDGLVVRSVLKDLVDSGLVYRSGRGDTTTYRWAPDEASEGHSDVAAHVWLAVHRHRGATPAALATELGLAPEVVQEALTRLVSDGRVVHHGEGYTTDECVIPYEDENAWEAAVFDHFQAVVTAISTKLHYGNRARRRDVVGGSTYRFDVCPGHPLEDEVKSLLGQVRDQATELRARVDAHNRQADAAICSEPVTFYVGQTCPVDDPDVGAIDSHDD